MNKRQAKKYKTKKVVDMMVNATTNSTVEEHKSGKISNTKRIKHYTTVVRQRFPKPQIKIAKKRTRSKPQWRKRLGAAPQDKTVETAFGRRVELKSHRTREEYYRQDRLRFINQFMARLLEVFPNASQEKVAEIYNWLLAHDSLEIDILLRRLGRSYSEMYYESDSIYHGEGGDMDKYIDDFLEEAQIIDDEGNLDELNELD